MLDKSQLLHSIARALQWSAVEREREGGAVSVPSSFKSLGAERLHPIPPEMQRPRARALRGLAAILISEGSLDLHLRRSERLTALAHSSPVASAPLSRSQPRRES
jgi:hypothetical protein